MQNNIPKPLNLWLRTRYTCLVLSSVIPLTNKIKKEIFDRTGIKITEKDVEHFPQCLKFYPNYKNIFYRGITLNDELYCQLKINGKAVTNRYFSCSKDLNIAKLFGNKIVLILNVEANFDISNVSREQEVILDKNVKLQLDEIKREDGFEYIFISEKS